VRCEICGYVARNGTTHSTAVVAIRSYFAFRCTSDENAFTSFLSAGIALDTSKYSSQSEISGSPSGAPDESNLLEYYAGLTSETLPPLRRRVESRDIETRRKKSEDMNVQNTAC
jgi:hypothetical protein